MKNSQGSQGIRDDFDKQGHRGCRGLMPENTIAGMLKALDLGVTTLEMDIVVTKDKKVVLSHEPWFSMDITTKPDGSYMGLREERKFNIYWMTYQEVKTFDVGLKPHPQFPQQEKMKAVKPLLGDIIDSSDAHAKKTGRPLPVYNIEIKSDTVFDEVFHPKPEEFVELLMAIINEKGIEERVIVQSFDLRPLQWLHAHYPLIKIALLIEGFDKRNLEDQLKALGFIPTTYSPHYSLINAALIKKCHRQNMKIIPWTVNDKEKIEKLRKLGVDGIITDYPNLFNE
jgi:glycerophosphoryl diester phosphodiesterase